MQKILIIIPVYNDWESFQILYKKIEKKIEGKLNWNVFLIDDGSSQVPSENINLLKNVKILKFKENKGHQEAIYQGLICAEKNSDLYDFIIIMDSDGEDRPECIKELISDLVKRESKSQHGNQCVVSSRKSRKNDVFFKSFYYIYKVVFFVLTGRLMNFGNFMVMNKRVLDSIVNTKTAQIHLASSLMYSGVRYSTVPQDRGERYKGKSKMNFSSLTNHAFNSFLVCKDRICARLFIMWLLLGLILSFDFSQIIYPTILFILFGIFLQLKFVRTLTLANRKIESLNLF